LTALNCHLIPENNFTADASLPRQSTATAGRRCWFAYFAWFAVNANREIHQIREREAPSGAAYCNPEGIESFSPALHDEGGLRRVIV
jgi:hypothetical protein